MQLPVETINYLRFPDWNEGRSMLAGALMLLEIVRGSWKPSFPKGILSPWTTYGMVS